MSSFQILATLIHKIIFGSFCFLSLEPFNGKLGKIILVTSSFLAPHCLYLLPPEVINSRG